MTDTTTSAPAPKKRSLFKRAAWQDAPKQDGDIFSHSNEFNDIVAEQNRRREEEKRKDDRVRQRKNSEPREKKRRRVSTENEKPSLPKGESSSSARADKTTSKARSRIPLSPTSSRSPPDSLTARYESLTKSASANESVSRKEPLVIDLSDDDDDASYNFKSYKGTTTLDFTALNGSSGHDISLRSKMCAPVDEDDEMEEVLDPTLAALRARARQRAALDSQSAAAPTPDGEPSRIPIAQLFIAPEMPDAAPLMVKVRIDSTIEKSRKAWCGKQGYSPEMMQNIFFTWKGMRLYDSTTIKRLGIIVDKNGNVSMEDDPNIYDDVNLPKVMVQAWTDELFKEHQKKEAAEAAAIKLAAEAPPEVEEREPTPEPTLQASKIRLILKARGMDEFRLSVKADTTFAHIANAYKTKHIIDKQQPLTLTFDGERLSPLDTIADSEIEDLDSIEVLFK